jgi:hypothetical protein
MARVLPGHTREHPFKGAETMHDAGATPSPEADPGRYESGEPTPEETLAGDPAEVDNEYRPALNARAPPPDGRAPC